MFFEEKIKSPGFAGNFYPSEKEELEKIIEKYFEKIETPNFPDKIFGILVPKDPYFLSGEVAAHSFKLIQNKDFRTIILLSDTQVTGSEEIISIWSEGKWETPLGEVPIEEDISKKLLNFSSKIIFKEKFHFLDPALEIQLPFLQKSLKNFKIVPILIGKRANWEKLFFPILNLIKEKKVLIICASNLSNSDSVTKTERKDQKIIKAIASLSERKLEKEISKNKKENCLFSFSENSIKLLLRITKNLKGKAQLLKYQTSKESIFGEKFEIKGYSAFVFFKSESKK